MKTTTYWTEINDVPVETVFIHELLPGQEVCAGNRIFTLNQNYRTPGPNYYLATYFKREVLSVDETHKVSLPPGDYFIKET